jgi:hypothetical protein
MAAGHRACAECRREDYLRLAELLGQTGADAIDARLHAERLDADGGRRLHAARIDGLPDGAFVLRDGEPWLVRGAELLRWTPAGYADRAPRPGRGRAVLVTPPSLVAVLRAGWRPLVPLLHPSADAQAPAATTNATSSTKHQLQSSPGSAERAIA